MIFLRYNKLRGHDVALFIYEFIYMYVKSVLNASDFLSPVRHCMIFYVQLWVLLTYKDCFRKRNSYELIPKNTLLYICIRTRTRKRAN